jgi:hypothetical protein
MATVTQDANAAALTRQGYRVGTRACPPHQHDPLHHRWRDRVSSRAHSISARGGVNDSWVPDSTSPAWTVDMSFA